MVVAVNAAPVVVILLTVNELTGEHKGVLGVNVYSLPLRLVKLFTLLLAVADDTISTGSGVTLKNELLSFKPIEAEIGPALFSWFE